MAAYPSATVYCLQMKGLWRDKQELTAETKRLAKEVEDTKVEAAYERDLRREHQGHAFLLAKERVRLLKMLAKERCELEPESDDSVELGGAADLLRLASSLKAMPWA
jgi:hypothetical protein